MAPACYPSTAESGRSSLLCEASLTLCPPLQRPRNPQPSLKSHDPTPGLERAGQKIATTGPTQRVEIMSHHPLPSLESQACVTRPGEQDRLSLYFKAFYSSLCQ
ncbi:hypothetical protein SLEP1_g42533 [Rubroshorea leprosula]|uniref:Uncharacterized protein n=1 Tax=Rubroshorea leprosula TaxID=152421 RepID=A0AAV5LA30_9ROSI|nr:hypothetical protein SLEP1_g42533 [Rubroshorea leprosula]